MIAGLVSTGPFFKTLLMKTISAFCILLLTTDCFSQKNNKSLAEALEGKMAVCGLVKEPDRNIGIFQLSGSLTGLGITAKNPSPLFVIDGIPSENIKILDSIKQENIESINILKYDKVSPSSCTYANRSIIFITTKKIFLQKFLIRDSYDRSPVSRATITFISNTNSDTIRLMANDSGILLTNMLKTGISYTTFVTATGYKSATWEFEKSFYQPGPVEISIARNVNTLPEAVIVSNIDYRTIRCGMRWKVTREKSKIAVSGKNSLLALYPNPLRAGKVFTIQKEFDNDVLLQVRILKADGAVIKYKQVKVFKGTNRISIDTDPGWPGGTYFIQLLCANGRVLASKPLIIQ